MYKNVMKCISNNYSTSNAKDNFLPIYLILKFTMNANEVWHGTL